MSFSGYSFVFDGIPSERFGLVVAGINNTNQSPGHMGGKLDIQEDRIARRSTGLHYGAISNEPLSFPISFTVDRDNHFLDRYDVAAIAGWLTGHQQYKKLVICQPDLLDVHYMCLITDLVSCEVGGRIVGFTATVSCNGPYAYRTAPATVFEFQNEEESVIYCNFSNVNDYYRPVIEISTQSTIVSIRNSTDGSLFTLSDMPAIAKTIRIDCLNQVMESSDGMNLYQHWNKDIKKVFPQFLRGANQLEVYGCTALTIKNEFPWNVGY